MKSPFAILIGVVLAWFLLSEAATEAWYRYKESQVAKTEPWPITFPEDPVEANSRGFQNYTSREMGDAEQEILRFDDALSATWRDPSGNQWTGFMIEWDSDKRKNNMDIAHNPTICLPAAGLTLVKEMPDREITIGDTTYRFNSWEFAAGSRPVWVYTAVRRDRELDTLDYSDDLHQKREAKVTKVLEGQRGNPLQTLQLVVVGPGDADGATDAVNQQLRELVGG